MNYSAYINGEWKQVISHEDCVDMINYHHKELIDENKRLKEELNSIRQEKWKDKELQKLKQENEKLQKDLIRGFPIYEEEQEKIYEWLESHHNEKEKLPRKNPNHGISKYVFESYPMVTFGTVYCKCGKYFQFKQE